MREPQFLGVSTRSDTIQGLCSQRRRLEASNFGLKQKRHCTIHEVKTKALISCAVTAQLICVFVFPYTKSLFSYDVSHLCLLRKSVL